MKILPQSLILLCEQYGVADLYAFGSRGPEMAAKLRGEDPACANPRSDADFGVRFGKNASWAMKAGGGSGQATKAFLLARLDASVGLAGELEALFEVDRVDLVDVAHADPFVAADAIRGELLYCKDPLEQAEFELSVLRRAGDLAWFKRREMNSLLYGARL